MKLLKNGLIPTAIIAAAISACGGGPDIEQVKADFDNPSGSGKDKNGVIAASGKQSTAGNNGALSVAGGGVPGFGLTSASASNLSKVGPLRIIQPYLRVTSSRSALRVDQVEADVDLFESGCIDNQEEVSEASAELTAGLLGGSDVDVSFSLQVSDLSKCDPSLSGGMEISYDLKSSGGELTIEAEASYDNVCDSESNSCLDGAFAISGFQRGNESEMVMAWDLKATGPDDDGNTYTIETKGGLRLKNGAAGSSFEYLQYVKDSNGDEVSYVLKLGNDNQGNLSLEIKCRDGSLTCSFNESNGVGMCTGEIDGSSFEISWTESEYDSVTESDDFKG